MWSSESVARGPAASGAGGVDASSLRLALFSGNYNYTRDGANQALNRLVRHLESRGAVCRVYSPTTGAPAFEPAGTLVSAPSVAVPGRPEYRAALGLSRALRRDIAAFRPNLIHISAPDALNVGAQKLGRKLGVPVVASMHTRFETYLDYYGLGFLRPAAERYLNRFYSGCDRILAPSAAMAATLSPDLNDRVRMWGRGVDRRQFSPAHRDDAWRQAHGFGPDDVVVAFLGRLVMEKGLDVLASTFALLKAREPRVKALIIGQGPAGDWLKERLPDAVFTGEVTGEALSRAVASADILLNPSLTETFGNATLESLAAGLVVIAPEAPSTRVLIEDGRNGVRVMEPSAEAYAEVIRALVADPPRRQALARTAREMSARWDWVEILDAVLAAYEEVTGPLGQRTATAA